MISIQGFDIFWKWWADLLNHGPAWAQFYEQDILQAVDAAGKKIKDAKGFEDKANDLSKPQTYTKYINHAYINYYIFNGWTRQVWPQKWYMISWFILQLIRSA